MPPAVPSKRFESLLQILWEHLVAANTHLDIWEQLRATAEREKLCDTYAGFFYWTRDAHIDRFVNKICVVTDTDLTQPGVEKLACMVLSHPSLAPGIDPAVVRQRLDSHEQAIREIRELRNRRSSHWDTKKLPPEPDIAQARALVAELKAILEDLSNAHEPLPDGARQHFSLEPLGHSHTAYVLDTLTQAMRAAHRR